MYISILHAESMKETKPTKPFTDTKKVVIKTIETKDGHVSDMNIIDHCKLLFTVNDL